MSKAITVIYNGRTYRRYPESLRRNHRVYFQTRRTGLKPTSYLHRDIWADVNGEIPKGHVIHHIDGNPLNNDITNLECIDVKKHSACHADLHKTDSQRLHLEAIRHLSKHWHSSKDGRRWHSEHAKKICSKRSPRQFACVQCSRSFETLDNKRVVKYCSRLCYERARPPRKGKDKKCNNCQKIYKAMNKRSSFCSKSCSTLAWQKKRRECSDAIH